MSVKKKAVRAAFRKACFDRDGHKCRMCGTVPENGDDGLDAHHITDRNDMPNGGYVRENGISLCAECHEKAEMFHSLGEPYPGYSPIDLYLKIGSTEAIARRASERLKV